MYFSTGATPKPAPGVQSFGYLKGEENLNRPYELVSDKNKPSKKILIGSADFDAHGTHLGVIVKTGLDLSKAFKIFKAATKNINDLMIRYNPAYPNSNSFVTTLLRRAGFPTIREIINSYIEKNAENSELFTNLFTPGAAVINITRADVVYDSRQARELQQVYGQLASKEDASKVSEQLVQDDKITSTWPKNKTFFDKDESDLVNRVNKEIENAGSGNVYVADINL